MTARAFKQVDVFSAAPYYGNPLAVVLDATGEQAGNTPDAATMQRLAGWTHLSETAFVLAPLDPSADYRVRIFTPGGELPFAGHPTLGSCHSWLEAGGRPKHSDFIVQECEIGLVKIRRDRAHPARLAFAAPPLRRSLPEPGLLAQVAAALGLDAAQIMAAQVLDNGPVWLGLLLDSPETLLQLTPDHLALERLKVKVGVAAFHARPPAPALIARANREARAFAQATITHDASGPDLEVRAFAACMGINEDPVTGSLNASLAQWLMSGEKTETKAPERYVASQGICLGRAGLVHLERDAAGQVWVGGDCVTCIDGTIEL